MPERNPGTEEWGQAIMCVYEENRVIETGKKGRNLE